MSFTWEFGADDTGFKRVRSYSVSPRPVIGSQDIVKYDGSIIRKFSDNNLWDAGDKANIYFDGTSSYLDLTVKDSDSGWGETYTPSADEIKAMVGFGFKMNNGTFGTAYNGTGTKTWTPYGATDNSAAVTVCPTTLASGYPGYKLSYELATSVTEVVQVEGALSVPAGGAQVSLAEGVIVREAVTPYLSGSTYYINAQNASAYLDNKAAQILRIDCETDKDPTWTLKTDGTANGAGYATASAIVADKDYYATYLLTDKYANTCNAVDADVAYQGSDHAVLARTTEKMADVETNVSIALNALVDVYARLKALEA